MSEYPHRVIIIPGLGDDVPRNRKLIENAVSQWPAEFTPIITSVLWRDGETFEPKLERILALVDLLLQKGVISVLGTSAGASMAFNVFAERRNRLNKAVNVCGRLCEGNHRIRSLERRAGTSIAFKQSVLAFQKVEPTFTTEERSRMMTIRPRFGDELVPHDTSYLKGANNRWIYTAEHGLSIYLALRHPQQILTFLSQ